MSDKSFNNQMCLALRRPSSAPDKNLNALMCLIMQQILEGAEPEKILKNLRTAANIAEDLISAKEGDVLRCNSIV